MDQRQNARLRAIIAVDSERAVRCQQPGCGHRVYAAVHIVQEGDDFLVLGSTCFSNRYGNAKALGSAAYGSGSGRALTEEERQVLLANTAALIAQFEEEERVKQAAVWAAEERLRAEREAIGQRAREQAERLQKIQPSQAAGNRPGALLGHASGSPWPWQSSRNTSIAVLEAPDGRVWVRVQHQDGSHKLVPWPAFAGWDDALPAEVGVPDAKVQGYAVRDIAHALRTLQSIGFSPPRVGSWRDLLHRRR